MHVSLTLYEDIDGSGLERKVEIEAHVQFGASSYYDPEIGAVRRGRRDECEIIMVFVDDIEVDDDEALEIVDILGRSRIFAECFEEAEQAA